jgi:hypothetical protein
MKCCEFGPSSLIYNASFSLKLLNGPKKLECFSQTNYYSLVLFNTPAFGAHSYVAKKINVVNMAPGHLFKTLHFLCNLRMGPKSWSVTLHQARKACWGKLSCLSGPFVSNKENEVLWFWLPDLHHQESGLQGQVRGWQQGRSGKKPIKNLNVMRHWEDML